LQLCGKIAPETETTFFFREDQKQEIHLAVLNFIGSEFSRRGWLDYADLKIVTKHGRSYHYSGSKWTDAQCIEFLRNLILEQYCEGKPLSAICETLPKSKSGLPLFSPFKIKDLILTSTKCANQVLKFIESLKYDNLAVYLNAASVNLFATCNKAAEPLLVIEGMTGILANHIYSFKIRTVRQGVFFFPFVCRLARLNLQKLFSMKLFLILIRFKMSPCSRFQPCTSTSKPVLFTFPLLMILRLLNGFKWTTET
jgi:hypothetical protein